MIPLSNRAAALKPSPTMALAAKAAEMKAKGQDVISLSLGEPDWDTFEVISKAGIQSIEKGQTRYTVANGILDLRKALAAQTLKDIGISYTPEQVSVTAGAKFVVFAALQVLCQAGDEVIIPAPYWVSYPTMVELTDAKPVIVQSGAETQFKLTASQLESAITAKTKALILNSPSNPTGEVYSVAELKSLAEVLKRHAHVCILSDDIYNRLYFASEGVAPHLLQVAPDLKDRVIVINGASKSFAMTGWRVGWSLGPSEVISAMNKYQSQSVSSAATFCQHAALAGVLRADEDVRKANQVLLKKRDLAFRSLQDIPGVRVTPPQGAFYIWPDISSYFGKNLGGRLIQNSKDFAEAFLDQHQVAVVPGIEFGMDGYLRMSFVLEEERMKEAFQRLNQFVKS